MAQLLFKASQTLISSNLEIADTTWLRLKGLLGKKQMHESEMLWIHNCNSIHTWFMNFPIDCAFLDKDLIVKKVCYNVKPWRLTIPAWSARSVIEMPAGTAKKLQLKVGDQLYVRT